jgi:Flp pilus assembly protein TadG
LAGVIRRPFARLRRRRAEESEHGAVATLVAVLLAGGVLLGIGAIVIDVGQLYIEREELQSGADAASFKIALNCVKVPANCTSGIQTPVAVIYAGKNAKDTVSGAQICLNNVGCPASYWNTAVTCPALPTPAAGNTNGSYVEVRTTTVTSTGSTLIPPSFAQALAGSTYTGKRVGACARVNWGNPAVAKVLAFGISLCDWNRLTAGNHFYNPVTSLITSGVLPLLGLTYPGSNSDGSIVKNVPGAGILRTTCNGTITDPLSRGFALLTNMNGTNPDANCMISVNVGDSPPASLGNDLVSLQACLGALAAIKGQAVLVPIWDTHTYSLFAPATYHIVGFAPFVLTGYAGLIGGLLGTLGNLVAAILAPLFPNTASLLSNGAPTDAIAQCGLNACLYGYFTKSLVTMPRPVFGTGNNYGATVIGRTG